MCLTKSTYFWQILSVGGAGGLLIQSSDAVHDAINLLDITPIAMYVIIYKGNKALLV